MGQGITIGRNIASLNAQRRLGEAISNLSKSYEKLSSGQRINRSSDDAAGLAIADTLSAKTKVYTKGVQNLNDGLSLVSIADAAVGQLTDITTRISELTEQAANGVYTNKQREAMDAEAQALAKEYLRIARSTQFNGVNLFDGSVQGLALQGGFGTDGMLASSLGGKLGTGNFSAKTDYALGTVPNSIALGDLNQDGILDLVSPSGSYTVSVSLGNGDGSFKGKSDFGTGYMPIFATLGDVNGDGIFDLVVANSYDCSASVLLGNGDGTFKAKKDYALAPGGYSYGLTLGDLNGDGALDIVSANTYVGSASVLLGNGDGSFRAHSDFATLANPNSVALGDVNADGILDVVINGGGSSISVFLGNGNGTFKAKLDLTTGTSPSSVALGDLNGDGFLDIVTANGGAASTSVLLGNGNGTFRAKSDISVATGPLTVALGDLNGDGSLDIVVGSSAGSTNSILLGNGDGSFRNSNTLTAGAQPRSVGLGDLNGDGVLDITSVGGVTGFASVFLANTRDGISPILPFSLRTKAEALQAMGPLKRTLDALGLQRGILGAFESRLSTATATLGAATENFQAAESRIRDADIAQESANLVRQQILQQVGSSILAQANQAPQIALNLLRA